MKYIITILAFFLLIGIVKGQENQKWKVGEGFNSIFQKLKAGKFKGTTYGILIVQQTNGQRTILDFQGSEGNLKIEKDEGEVYDVSTKSYIGKTTSGLTEIKYETYHFANRIGIKLNGQWFELSSIDGASDMIINGLDYFYSVDEKYEYLSIIIKNELELNNWQYLLRNYHTMEPDNVEELKLQKKIIKILPNSTKVFAIKK